MHLTIEPPGATRTTHLAHTAPLTALPHAAVLDFAIETQALSTWCWAAVAVSIAAFYQAKAWNQDQLASTLLFRDCMRAWERPECRADCDQCAMLDEALKLVGCYSHWSPGRPTVERIQDELKAGRPLCVRIEWAGGSAHYAVIYGYYADTRELVVADSRYGLSVQPFDAFPQTYRMRSGIWCETFWTRPPTLSGGVERDRG